MENLQAFVYKWIHKPTGKWYIGSRTAKGCHINDGYICSSKIVKPMIEQNPEEWERYILKEGSVSEMRKHEASLLKLHNAKDDPMSFNRSNADVAPGGKKGMKKRYTIERAEKILLRDYKEDYKKHPDLKPRELWRLGNQKFIINMKNEQDLMRKLLYDAFIMEFLFGKETI